MVYNQDMDIFIIISSLIWLFLSFGMRRTYLTLYVFFANLVLFLSIIFFIFFNRDLPSWYLLIFSVLVFLGLGSLFHIVVSGIPIVNDIVLFISRIWQSIIRTNLTDHEKNILLSQEKKIKAEITVSLINEWEKK